ncbi:MAG: AMP-binding protein [Oligoflexus sp.]
MQTPWLKQYHAKISPQIHVPENLSIADLIDQACETYADKTSLTCMGKDISFAEFQAFGNSFASFLQNEIGLEKGERIAIMLPNLMQMPIAMYGAFKLGLVCVNTNPLYTPREMKHQFKDSGAKAVVILDLFLDKLEEIIQDTDIQHVIVASLGDHLPSLKGKLITTVLKLKKMIPKHSLRVIRYRDALKLGSEGTYRRPEMSSEDLAALQYTGGTTGVAKGAMLTQKNILANVMQVQAWSKPYILRGEETILTALPLYHIFSLSVNFLTFLTLGNRMILVPKPVPIVNLVKIFKQYRITVMTGVNTLFNALNHDKDFQKMAIRDLKFVVAGATALQPSVERQFFKITRTNITEGYGLTEASPVTHCNLVDGGTVVGSIGLPLPSTEARIVNDEGVDVEPGEVGELIIRGPQVMKGYWNKDEETAKTLRDGWLWTGDMARMDEKGYFYIVDRKKDMILVSGFNVYPNEIEAVLASHPKVVEAGVVGVTDEKSGEAVKAYIVKKDESLTETEIMEFCRKNLTAYKCPKHIEFTDTLPKTNIGKILRRELKAQEPKDLAS